MGKADIEELRKEALEWLRKHDWTPVLHSCWKCNPSHEHLKEADYVILCPFCGRWYYKGVDVTVDDEEGETNG